MQKRNKLLLGGLSTSAVVAGVALTGGTSAYYYDLEHAPGNSFTACDFDLERTSTTVTQTGFAGGGTSTQVPTADLTNSSGAGNVSVNLSNLQPGDAFTVEILLDNTGGCAGELWADIDYPIYDKENGQSEPEIAAGDGTPLDVHNPDPNNAPQGGELDDYIDVTFADSNNSYGPAKFEEMSYRPADMLDADFIGGETDTITVTLSVPDGGPGVGNQIMGDSFTFDVKFALAQKNKVASGGGLPSL